MYRARVRDLAVPPAYPAHLSAPRSVSAAALLPAAEPSRAEPTCLSRALSHQLTYFLSSQPLAPVYKPLPAEDVEYSAWKIDGRSPQAAERKNKKIHFFFKDNKKAREGERRAGNEGLRVNNCCQRDGRLTGD